MFKSREKDIKFLVRMTKKNYEREHLPGKTALISIERKPKNIKKKNFEPQ